MLSSSAPTYTYGVVATGLPPASPPLPALVEPLPPLPPLLDEPDEEPEALDEPDEEALDVAPLPPHAASNGSTTGRKEAARRTIDPV
jgi:hypothetical protein